MIKPIYRVIKLGKKTQMFDNISDVIEEVFNGECYALIIEGMYREVLIDPSVLTEADVADICLKLYSPIE